MAKTNISPEHLERFKMWYVRPFHWLRSQGGIKQVEPWDGGFIALMIGCSLMERYFRFKTGTHKHLSKKEKDKWNTSNKSDYDTAFKDGAADHFGICKVRIHDFYTIFRNGIMHQGMPKVIEGKDNNGKVVNTWEWYIKAGASKLPDRIKRDKGKFEISVDPWAFTQTMIELFLSDAEALEADFEMGLAQIYSE